MQESNVNEFRIIDKLGEGSFADVYKVKSVNNQKIYAEKRLKKRYRSLEEVRNLTEVSALKLLSRHPNIITLHSLMYDTQTGHVALIFEQMEMNLFDFLSKRKTPLDEYSALLLMYQLTKAVHYVHSCGIFHRDIKPENCLVNSDILELKLADFGSVSPIANRTRFTEYVATRWYRAPECILTTGAYGPPVDMWAIGCVFFEVLTMKPLFPGKHQLDQINIIHSILGTPSRDVLANFQNAAGGQPSKVGFAFPEKTKQTFESLLPGVSIEIVDLIKRMVTYDPSDRITAADAIKHPAFRHFYQLDAAWQKTSRQAPFSVYAMQGRNEAPRIFPTNVENTPNPHQNQIPTNNTISPNNTTTTNNTLKTNNNNIITNNNTLNNNTVMNNSNSGNINSNNNVYGQGNDENNNININNDIISENKTIIKNNLTNNSITNNSLNSGTTNSSLKSTASNLSNSLNGSHISPNSGKNISALDSSGPTNKPPPALIDHLRHKQPTHSHLHGPPNKPPGPQMNSLETRRVAAQRIVDYHKRQMVQKAKVVSGQKKTTTKPVVRLGASTLYQKPRPEMIQPRLPPIGYPPLKRQ
ncbi:CMGC family protein kinase [Tritrichomonas foetus]|uniref:CMGC family protein kinase n=1 Tax=Tritrichomonas foetus TaxID=1144522 RepID=A0A1J4JK52_9EUKA|nr:CMGC family protein kinase [Tritrichomonas foetus]|eukprot:OHS99512.1 CMGC family protein kinase [Tritrichomonas foetus]